MKKSAIHRSVWLTLLLLAFHARCALHPLTDVFDLQKESEDETAEYLILGALLGELSLIPVFSLDDSLTYYSAQSVTVTTGNAAATIHYTLDGSDPDCSSTPYTGPIVAPANAVTEIRALGCVTDENGTRSSSISQALYVMAPILIGSYNTPSQAFASAISGDYAFVADWGLSDLRIVDISDPTNPSPALQYNPFGNARAIHLDGTRIYLSMHANGWLAYDIAGAPFATLLGSQDPGGITYDVDVDGNILYAATSSGVRAIDISAIGSASTLGTDFSSGAEAVEAEGTLVFAARAGNGFQVLDFSVPSSPLVIGTYGSTNATDVKIDQNLAYVADGSGGLLILDISDPAAPSLLGSYAIAMDAYKLDVIGTTVAVADMSAGLKLFDVSNPAGPVPLVTYPMTGPTNGVTIDANYVYVCDDVNGFFIFRYKK